MSIFLGIQRLVHYLRLLISQGEGIPMIARFGMRVAVVAVLSVAAAAGPGAPRAAAQVAAMVGATAAATDSTATTIPEGLEKAEIDALVARLTDLDARRILLERLHRDAEERAAGAGQGSAGGIGVALARARFRLEAYTETFGERLALLASGAGMAPEAVRTALNRVSGGAGGLGFPVLLASLAALLAAGMAAHWGVLRLTRDSRRRLEDVQAPGLGARISRALLRAVFDAGALVAFAIVSIGLSAVLFAESAAGRTFVVTYLTAAAVVYATAMLSRLALAPEVPALRLAPVGDAVASFVHRWLVRLAAVAGIAWLTAGLVILTGMPIEAHLLIVVVTGGIVFLAVIAMIVDARAPVAAVIRSAGEAAQPGQGARLREQLAETWHYFAILYMIVVWMLWAMSMLARGPSTVWAAIASIVVVAALPMVDRAVGRVLADLFKVGEEGGSRGQYAVVVQRGTRAILVVSAGIVLLQLWGVNLFGGAGPQASAAFGEAGFDVAVTLLLAYVIWQVVKTATDRHLGSTEVDGKTVGPSARALTLVPLFRKCVLAVLGAMVTMIVLSSIGVDIGPLLAGAGVIGLAVGFGAQTLVRDIVSGVFFLIDDAFRIGEYIEMGDIRGEVEGISLRSLRLRHHRGAIHTIPFGELRSITNYNRDWVIYKMEFRVPYDTDIEKVRKIIKKIGQEMMEDAEIGPNLIEPLKSQGVSRMEDSAIIIRAKFMSKPREQFVIRRVAYQRIKQAFEENGIRFAHRNVTVHVPRGASADSAPAAAAALAAEGEGT